VGDADAGEAAERAGALDRPALGAGVGVAAGHEREPSARRADPHDAVQHDGAAHRVGERDHVAAPGVARGDLVEPHDVARAQRRAHGVGHLDVRPDAGRRGEQQRARREDGRREQHARQATAPARRPRGRGSRGRA
jgi:hypothetical protein